MIVIGYANANDAVQMHIAHDMAQYYDKDDSSTSGRPAASGIEHIANPIKA